MKRCQRLGNISLEIKYLAGTVSVHAAERLLMTLRFCVHLKGSTHVRGALAKVGLHLGLSADWMDRDAEMFGQLSRQTLGRKRFHCDAAHCMLQR